jgi:hypothetical protein
VSVWIGWIRLGVGRFGAVEDELEDLGGGLIHRGAGAAEKAIEGLFGHAAASGNAGDAIEDFTIIEVEVKGAQAFAEVEASQELGAGGAFGGGHFRGDAGDQGNVTGDVGGIDFGDPEEVLAAAAHDEGVARGGDGRGEFFGVEEVSGCLEYGVHRDVIGYASSIVLGEEPSPPFYLPIYNGRGDND